MRKKIIAGNWKMNYCVNKAEDFVSEIKDAINTDEVDVVICPNFVSLDRISDLLDGTNIKLGAQNVHTEDKGAYTGETSVNMLAAVGVKYCIVGHSERRQDQKESDEEIHDKVERLFEAGITPILCCGETKEEREEGREKEVIGRELDIALNGISEEDKARVIIAYEPIWSIGTGLIPTNNQIIDIIEFIKSKYNCKVLYGGSANDTNIDDLKQCSCIDGYLLGGLSLKPENLKVFVNKL